MNQGTNNNPRPPMEYLDATRSGDTLGGMCPSGETRTVYSAYVVPAGKTTYLDSIVMNAYVSAAMASELMAVINISVGTIAQGYDAIAPMVFSLKDAGKVFSFAVPCHIRMKAGEDVRGIADATALTENLHWDVTLLFNEYSSVMGDNL